jgi:hypothetical protein
MDKAFWRKMKLGFLTLSSIGLLAACGMMDNIPGMGSDDAPVEEPATNEEMPPGGSEDGSNNGGAETPPSGGDSSGEGETTDN